MEVTTYSNHTLPLPLSLLQVQRSLKPTAERHHRPTLPFPT